MKRLILLLIVFCASSPAHAIGPVVADLSTYRVDIDAGFSGTRLFLFGARDEGGDVVVVLRGPSKNFTVWKKERMLGIWVNNNSLAFKQIPEFYQIISARPLNALKADRLLSVLGIGQKQLLSTPTDIHAQARFPEFSEALIAHQQRKRQYQERQGIQFVGETLFKTTLELPDNLPKGDYTAEIYLISDGELAGMHVIPVKVAKSGFDAKVSDLAHHNPVLYGLLAIAIAGLVGWGTGRIFEHV